MTGMVRQFADGDRERLIKLFRQLGTDNIHEAEAARGRIDSLFRQFGKNWTNLVELLSGGTLTIDPTLACDIAGLGDPDHDQRANARRNLTELLARHRKNWNDLADALCSVTSAAWMGNSPDPARVNPLRLVHHLLGEYVGLESHEYVAIALWVLHTWVFDRFMVTPRLGLRSPVAGCGKTVLIDVLAKLVAKPEKFDSITAAAIYHLIDETHPTVLIDEADNLSLGLQTNGKIRAVFNSGHRKDRTLGIMERGRTRKFSTFAPLALALPDSVSGLPRTLNSRCITIMMERNDGRRELRRFDVNDPDPAMDAAYTQIFMWRRDAQLNPDPEMPAGKDINRFADNWRPLLAIADALEWGTQAREAMIHFAQKYQDADVRILLLGDIRKVFDANAVDRLPTKALIDALHALVDAEWSEFRGIRGEQQPHRLKDGELSMLLRDFGIRPRTIWPLNRTAQSRSAKGYRRWQFEKVWRAYCADDGTAAQSNNVKNLRRADRGTA